MILEYVKENYGYVEKTDSFSDSESAQFKQKYMFSNLEYWETKFKCQIQWYIFATSHGKGVVDGKVAQKRISSSKKINWKSNSYS